MTKKLVTAFLLSLVLLVALAGCGTVRALAGPDPAVGSHAATYKEALAEAKGAHPEKAAEYDAAWEALGVYLANDRSGLIPTVVSLLALLTPANVGVGLSLALGAVAAWKGRKTAAAVDQHAALIDSVTPESAEFAARAKAKTPSA